MISKQAVTPGTQQAAEFVVKSKLEDFPPEVVAAAKLHMLDCIGVMLGGLKTSAARIAAEFAHEMGEIEESTVFATGRKGSSVAATFANSNAAAVLDYEDGHMGSYHHPASVIYPPILALAERENSLGRTVLEASVVAYEVGLRCGLMLRRRGGMHATGATGAFAGAAGTSKVLGLDKQHAAEALGIAGCTFPISFGSGNSSHGPHVKEAIGWGAATGIASTLQAQLGFTGGYTPLDTRTDGTEPFPYYPFDGKNWELLKTYFKFYPACRFTHAPLDSFFRLVKEHNLTKDKIAMVLVETAQGPNTLNTKRPISLEHAQYSIPFVFGCAINYGKVTPTEVAEDRLNDPAALEFAKKVFVQQNFDMDGLYPRRYPAIVNITTTDGKTYSMRKETCTGDYDEPMTVDQIKDKFRANAEPVIGKTRAEKAISLIDGLEKVRSVREVVEQLKVNGARR
ncbi:MAG: MmgE/PrpD family protein [Chloroflexi bacterium]|nr:MmgE/PrpD family protein [Chloroflexota bacterium]